MSDFVSKDQNCRQESQFQFKCLFITLASNHEVQLTESYDCQTKNIIYLIECRKTNCSKRQYIGKTTDPLTKRFGAHHDYVRNKLLAKATGAHFNLPGHQMSDMSITVVEKIYNQNPLFLREREAVNINLFNVKDQGINKYSWRQLQPIFKNFLSGSFEPYFYPQCSVILDSHLKRAVVQTAENICDRVLYELNLVVWISSSRHNSDGFQSSYGHVFWDPTFFWLTLYV